eukprot:g3689.t1
MDNQSVLQSKIDALQARIDAVEDKQEQVERALTGNGSYLGTTDHDELTKSLRILQKKGELLQEEKLILLRRQETLPLASAPQQSPESPEISAASNGSGARGGVKRKSSEQPEDEESRHSNGARRSSRMRAIQERKNGDQSAVGTQQQDVTTIKKEEPEVRTTTGDGAMRRAPQYGLRFLTIRVRDQTGETFFKVRNTTAFIEVKNAYAARTGVQLAALRFLLVGHVVEDDDTPVSLELENGDQIDVMLQQQGGKPVILLYPSAPLDATVALELSPLWSISALYPKPPSNKLQHASASEAIVGGGQQCKWNVHASPDGSLEDLSTGREYPYLFWEADSCDGRVSRSFDLDQTRSFCVAGDAAGVFLDGALERLGLNMRERCDMVTYWLPQLESSPFNVIYFVDVKRYEKAARLTIAPAPDVTIRVFMAFRGVKAYDAELDTAKMEELRAPVRKGFVAVEWGGMNLNGKVQH